MTVNKNKQPISIQFDIHQLNNITFGKLEGERDPFLKDCFFPTRKVQKYLIDPYNYVLSPKGAGKSALFRIISDNLVHESLFDLTEYSVIAINEAFGFEDNYLNVTQFAEESRMKLTVSWALFILTKTVNHVKKQHRELSGYSKLMSELKKIIELKEKFNLYDLGDFLKSVSASIVFTANGQEFEVAPKVAITSQKKKLVLNSLFEKINEFFKKNDLKCLILIDRIDNFVQKEEYQLQRKYIQGLFDCIEEISLYSHIKPTMFLRTDLFYSYESDIEYDKVKDRTLELEWDKGETLNFIVYRLNHNQYISQNFNPLLSEYLDEAFKGKFRQMKPRNHSWLRRTWERIFPKGRKKLKLDITKPLNYTVSEKYLKLFFPHRVECNQTLDLCDWIFTYLKDANSFVNPRLLIYFFNQLFEKQAEINLKFYPEKDKNVSASTLNGEFYFDLFNDEAFEMTYEKVQQDELKNIYTIIKKKEYQDIFRVINLKSMESGEFRYGDVNIKKLKIEKDVYESLLKYLKLLGFCKEEQKQYFGVPPIYRAKLKLI